MSIALPNEAEVPPGPRRDLLCDLRVLYDAAGKPPTRQISNWTRQDPGVAEISPDLVSRVLRGSVPRWKNLESLVRVLLAHPTIDPVIGTPEEHLRRIHKIWVLADDGGRPGPAIPAPNGRRDDPRLRELTRAALDSDVRSLYYELARLREGEGLTWSKLSRRPGLLNIPAISKRIAFEPDDPASSVIRLIRDSIRQMPVSDRLVADIVLSLGLHQAEFHDLDDRRLYRLYGNSLGGRRGFLLSNWHRLHAALGIEKPPLPPSDRRLRGVIEERILRDLADLVLRPGLDPESSARAEE